MKAKPDVSLLGMASTTMVRLDALTLPPPRSGCEWVGVVVNVVGEETFGWEGYRCDFPRFTARIEFMERRKRKARAR